MNCCFNCQSRQVGCHSTCTKYLLYKQSIAQTNANRKEYKQYFGLAADHISARLKRCKHTGERFY